MDTADLMTATRQVQRWLSDFGAALEGREVEKAVAMFATECFWRDLVTFTWNISTLEGREAVAAMLTATLSGVRPTAWKIEGDAGQADGVTEAWITFETATARGRGHLRLKDDLCWTLLTTMTELKGYEEPRGPNRPKGVDHGVARGRKTWLDQRAQEEAELGHTTQPYCVIVGGGQGGLALGARLKRLGVPTLIVDRNERPGDSWRKRYKSLCLHDPVWYDHLPYMPFPDHWPVFSPKDKIGDWLEMYAKVMELNVWSSSEAKRASFDQTTKEWQVVVDRAGEEIVLRPKQLVLATGMSGIPNLPTFPGQETFRGTQCHSSRYRSGEGWSGKQAVVIGSNNSAHDICADLWESGAEVTMVQRTSTHVARSDTLMELGLGDLYSERAVANGITTDSADLIFASIPYKIMHTFQIPVYQKMAEQDAEFYKRLRRVGFMLDFGEDESGLFMKYLRRGSGYYIDVGASELIANAQIKLKSGVSVKEIREHSVVLSDGSELPADLIIYATGYGSMNGWAARIISQEVGDKVGKCWGLGSGTAKDPGPWEGELRNMWKPTQQEALWFHGGNLHQSRHYSQFLALQLKARKEGLPTPVWGLPEVWHLS